MRRIIAPLATTALLAAGIVTAAPALADKPGTSSDDIVGVVHLISPTSAEVQVRYSCTEAASPDQMHLWVSVKQSANGTADPALAVGGTGYGGQAAAWSQSHAGVADLVCDGHTHVGRFLVDRNEPGYGSFQKGDAYVQFCMFDATHPFDQSADPESPDAVQPISSMEFVHVR